MRGNHAPTEYVLIAVRRQARPLLRQGELHGLGRQTAITRRHAVEALWMAFLLESLSNAEVLACNLVLNALYIGRFHTLV